MTRRVVRVMRLALRAFLSPCKFNGSTNARSFVQSHSLYCTSNALTQSTFSDVVRWNELPRCGFHPVKYHTIVEEEIQVPYGRQIHDSSSTAMLDDGDRDRNTDGEQE